MKNEFTFPSYGAAANTLKKQGIDDPAFILFSYLHGDKFDTVEALQAAFDKLPTGSKHGFLKIGNQVK